MTGGLLEQAVADALTEVLPGVVDRLAGLAGPRAYTVAEVAVRLALSENTVRRLIAAGHLATVPHLNPARVAASTLAEFLAAKETP